MAGLISGFFGAGGGLILIPFFGKYLNMEETKSRATAIFVIMFLVLISSVFYFKDGNINFSLGIKCAMGGIFRKLFRLKTFSKIKF
ncbi:MAG: sulfite exporter TauE/SafE family protein [Clostridia bacterium]|nr:sulfite exporter TauE/SafE family protein [Clostridia bacterium]